MRTGTPATSEGPVVAGTISSRAVWIGRVLSALALVFLTFDTVIKLFMLPVAVDATKELGFTERAVFTIGAIEAACLALDLAPRTSVLGAVLWTGYFGGAIVTHLRVGSPLFTHTLYSRSTWPRSCGCACGSATHACAAPSARRSTPTSTASYTTIDSGSWLPCPSRVSTRISTSTARPPRRLRSMSACSARRK